MKTFRFMIHFKPFWQSGFSVDNCPREVIVNNSHEWAARAADLARDGFFYQTAGGYTFVPGHSITHINVEFRGDV